jgi:3-methyladenine DNA glycosylase AlkD
MAKRTCGLMIGMQHQPWPTKMKNPMIEFCQENFNDFIQILHAKQDLKYKEFNDKVVNGVGESIGIRIPDLRLMAKGIAKSEKSLEMLEILDQQNLFEIRMVEGMLIGIIKPTDDVLKNLIVNFVEHRINNWALCDCFVSSLKTKVKQDKQWFYEIAKRYANSGNIWEIRFGLVMFLCYFKEKAYFADITQIILDIKSQEYYVRMGAAWLISVLYIELKEETLELLKHEKIDTWTRNKAIQKIKESFRVAIEDKKEAEGVKKSSLS